MTRSGTFRMIRGLLAALGLFSLISCMLDGRTAGRGSEVENEVGVYGVLVDGSGDPVSGAKVKAATASLGVGKRSADPDSVLTDKNGKYRFAKLAKGEYDVFGDFGSGALVVLIPRVDVAGPAEPRNLGTDTMRAPGRIRGRLLLAGKGMAEVLCFVPGTSFLAISDDSGGCILDRIPQGRYTVRYSLAGFSIASDSGVQVLSGLTTDLPAKSLDHDTALPPPPPAGLGATYDTLKEQVRLRWPAVAVKDLDGYVVHRKSPGAAVPEPVPGGFTGDTVFIDSTLGKIDPAGALEFTYLLKSRDRNSNLSATFSPPASVRAVSMLEVTTLLAWKAGPGTRDSLLLGDSITLIIGFSNPTRKIGRIEWRSGESHSVPVKITEPDARSGSDTLQWKPVSEGESEWRVSFLDASGTVWTATRRLSVLPQSANRPKAAVRLGSPEIFTSGTIPVSARESRDAIGKIVKYEFGWADSGFLEMPGGGPDMVLQAPDEPAAAATLRIRVTDDDGLSDTASITFPIRSGTGWENLQANFPGVDYSSTVVFQGKLWTFATGSDGSGAWNSPDGKTWTPVPHLSGVNRASAGGLVHGGRIWLFAKNYSDECALFSTDGAETWRREVLPEALLKRDFFSVAGFQGRMWVIGGDDSTGGYADAWSSEDGRAWKRESAEIAPGRRTTFNLTVWKDRLWLYGGLRSRNGFGLKFLNDLWSSADGVTWKLEAEAALPSERWVAGMVPFQDGLWIIGGVDGAGQQYNDIWRSSDGIRWLKAPGTAPFSARRIRGLVEFQDRMFLLGGWNVSSFNIGEVWRSP
jgi:hypothetical protein